MCVGVCGGGGDELGWGLGLGGLALTRGCCDGEELGREMEGGMGLMFMIVGGKERLVEPLESFRVAKERMVEGFMTGHWLNDKPKAR